MRRPIILAVLLLALASYPAAHNSSPAVRALFIGNSLTYENNLPAMIEAVAASAGLKGRVVCRGVAMPDFGLQEHWDQGDALRGIRNGQWTHVVLQQGPSSQPDSRVILREFTKKFAFEVKAKGAKVVLYSTWTSRNRLNFMDDVVESYRLAARGRRRVAGAGRRRLAGSLASGSLTPALRDGPVPSVADGHIPRRLDVLPASDRQERRRVAAAGYDRQSAAGSQSRRRTAEDPAGSSSPEGLAFACGWGRKVGISGRLQARAENSQAATSGFCRPSRADPEALHGKPAHAGRRHRRRTSSGLLRQHRTAPAVPAFR